MCLTPAAAAIPSARRPALELPIFIATPTDGGGVVDLAEERGQMAREVVEVAARGHDVDEAEQRGLELGVRGRQVHRLLVEHLQRVARRRQRGGQLATHLEQLAFHRPLVGHGCELTPPVPCPAWIASRNCSASWLPMYEEQETVGPFTERVASALGDVPYELILVNDGSKDDDGGGDGRRRGRRSARQGRLALAQLRPPAGADGGPRARPRRRDRDDRRRPPGPAGGDPRDARALARGHRRRLRRARGSGWGRPPSSASPRAASTAPSAASRASTSPSSPATSA